jgi:hypothetical protein
VGNWIETRGLVLRADGLDVTVMRNATIFMTPVEAVRIVDDGGQALWLASFAWRPLKGLPRLRRLRVLREGVGFWESALAAFLMRRSQPRGAGTQVMRHGHAVT